MTKAQATAAIAKHFSREDWAAARQVIEKELAKKPDDHWLLTRLSSTYYEEKDYKKALKYASKAHEIMPDCPLVLWDLANAYDMLGEHHKAISLYGDILDKGGTPGGFVHDCGESPEWLASLSADAIFRSAVCLGKIGAKNAMIDLLNLFKMLSKRDYYEGIYSTADANKILNQLNPDFRDIVDSASKAIKANTPTSDAVCVG